ncbi:hypothetical protein ABZ642_42185 [Streptomyces sp. NPDC007157]|uniref:hypothetical protein n=1 Tax=Streptomyces sp. NPDC007157 TaxID=3154681 RepID=UPI0033CE6916
MIFNHLRLDRLRARPVTHMQPASPEQWQDVDELHFEAIEAEIERRAAGGSPDEAPWASARYFDAGPRQGTTALQVFIVLRHLSGEAVTHLLAMGQLLRDRLTDRKQSAALEAPACTPTDACDHNDHGTDRGLDLIARTRRKETTNAAAPDNRKTDDIAEEQISNAVLTG